MGRGATWDERLDAWRAAGSPASTTAAADLLRLWTQTFSPGDPGALERRLAWDGLRASDVAAIAGTTPASLPWADLLAEALARAPGVLAELETGQLPEATLVADREPPFYELWVPFLRVARGRMWSAPPNDLLSEEARRALEVRLLAELGDCADQTLLESFDAFRAHSPAPAKGSRALYDRFVRGLLESRLLPFLVDNPSLARQLAVVTRDAVERTRELLFRLRTDLDQLERRFGATGKVTELDPALSDRHNGGRSVVSLKFASGARVICKPRHVGTESAWSAVLEWLSGRGLDPAPPAIAFLDRGAYGYAAFVESEPLASHAEAEDYFRAAGSLLAVAWAFGARDLHMGNILATRRGPVVVDAEMVLQPERAETEGGPGARELAADRLRRTFLSTGLFTTLQDSGRGRLIEVGGLRGEGGLAAVEKTRAVVDRNTDAMRAEWEPHVSPRLPNLPSLSDRRLRPDDVPEAFISGFESGYRQLLASRGELLAPDGPLGRFEGQPIRVVFRQSAQYAALLGVLLGPRYQKDGLLRSLAIDSLNRVFREEKKRPSLWPLTAEERAALENWDLPYFTLPADATDLVGRQDGKVSGVFSRSGLDAARARLDSMSEKDLAEQVSVLRSSLLSDAEVVPGEGARQPVVPAASGAALFAAALRLGERVLEAAITTPTGAAWLVPSYLKGAEREDRGGPYYLYDGAAGIALFLAALSRRTGREDFRRAARAAFAPVAETLESSAVSLALANEGVGACNGLGSLVYALALVASFERDDGLVDLARRVASHVTQDRLDRDERLDVEGGAAGAILGLLALHSLTGDEDALARAALAGDHLLKTRHPEGGWPGTDGARRAGFAHGAAGIAVALARLFRATGREELLLAARDAARYERTIFDAARRNWPVLSPGGDNERRVFRTAWCHGAPGIALSRVDLLSELGVEGRADLETALATTRETGFLAVDHVCCGNAAFVEILDVAGEALDRPELREEARVRAAALLSRASLEGDFRLRISPAENAAQEPGFFTGLSGIGYTFLRLEGARPLPSVLLFEPPTSPKNAAA